LTEATDVIPRYPVVPLRMLSKASTTIVILTAGFSPAGKYYGLLTQGNMAEYAVLDIRGNHTQQILHHHKNLYHVLFANDFKSSELRLGSEVLATLYLDTRDRKRVLLVSSMSSATM